MKNTTKLIIALALILCLIASFAACKKKAYDKVYLTDTDGETVTDTDGNPIVETKDIETTTEFHFDVSTGNDDVIQDGGENKDTGWGVFVPVS